MTRSISRRSVLSIGAVAGGLVLTGTPSAFAVESTNFLTPQVNEAALQQLLDGAINGSTQTLPTLRPAMAQPLAAMSSFDSFVSQNLNRYIDVDGAYGAQCWDLWELYCRNVIGCSGISTQYSSHPGYAIALWDGYASNGASTYFNQVSASATPRKGDVAIWKFGQTYYPQSHVALVLGDAGTNLYVFSQNSSPSLAGNPFPGQSTGPCAKQNLPKAGLAGYLRPKSLAGGGTQEEVSSADILAVDSAGVLWNYPARGNGTFLAKVMIGSGWSGMQTGWTVDFNGNGVLDLIVQWSDGHIRYYPGKPGGGFGVYTIIGQGWSTYQIAPAKWRLTDKYPGLLAKDSTGDLYYYPNPAGTGLDGTKRVKIGNGWGTLSINAMNFNADSYADVLALNLAGELLLYPGNGSGGFGAYSKVGHGFASKGLLTTRGFMGGGTKGLMMQRSTGELRYYPLTSGGAFQAPSDVGHGFSTFKLFNTQ